MGLTLVELLVVIALLGLLLALALPALGRGKTLARRIGCQANLSQWGRATYLYTVDHEDYLPRDGSPNGTSLQEGWYVELPRELGIPTYPEMPWRTNAAVDPGRSLWICPANVRRSNGHNLFHYCLNQHVNGTGKDNQPVKLTAISQPVRQVWLFDNGRQAAVAQQNNVHTNLHSRGALFLFLDGHVAFYPARVYWDFARGGGRTNQPELRWIP